MRWQVEAGGRRTDSSHSSPDDFSTCQAPSRYLQEAYGCRRSKFYEFSQTDRRRLHGILIVISTLAGRCLIYVSFGFQSDG
jgi:hypothetical protein